MVARSLGAVQGSQGSTCQHNRIHGGDFRKAGADSLLQVKRVAGETGDRARALMSQLSALLTEGAVTADTLLDSVPRILSVVRESNVALRWMLLHMAPLTPAVAQVLKISYLE